MLWQKKISKFNNAKEAREYCEEEIKNIESNLATTAGTCAIMGTASTMALLSDVMGIMLPGTASIPAVHADRLRAGEETGILAAKMAINKTNIPSKIITKKSAEVAAMCNISNTVQLKKVWGNQTIYDVPCYDISLMNFLN